MAQDSFLNPPLPDIIAQWRDYFRALQLQPGQRVLDIGCQKGDADRLLLREFPTPGKVVALDLKHKSLAEALARWRQDGAPGPLEYHQADAHHLPYPDASFDRLICAETLEYLIDPPRALSEMRRVLRPGGLALLTHTDYDTQVFNATDKALCRKLVLVFSDMGPNGQMGRQLYALCSAAGFASVAPEVYPLTNTDWQPDRYGYRAAHMLVEWLCLEQRASPDECDRWLADLSAQAARGAYFYSVNRYVCVCQK
jgi:arsenite methyltransferase